ALDPRAATHAVGAGAGPRPAGRVLEHVPLRAARGRVLRRPAAARPAAPQRTAERRHATARRAGRRRRCRAPPERRQLLYLEVSDGAPSGAARGLEHPAARLPRHAGQPRATRGQRRRVAAGRARPESRRGRAHARPVARRLRHVPRVGERGRSAIRRARAAHGVDPRVRRRRRGRDTRVGDPAAGRRRARRALSGSAASRCCDRVRRLTLPPRRSTRADVRTCAACLLAVCLVTAAVLDAADSLVWSTDRGEVDAHIESWPLPRVLEAISSETGWQIYVEPDAHHTVSVRFKKLKPREALDRLLAGYNFALLPQVSGPAKLFVYRNSVNDATELIHVTGKADHRRSRPIPTELIVPLKHGT